MKKNEIFLKALDEATREAQKEERRNSDSERALFLLLKGFEKHLPEIDDYFHKAFRQVDVIPDFDEQISSGHIDSAIWVLLDKSKIFWEVYAELEIKDKEEEGKENE